MKKVLMGNHAASWGAKLSRVKMIAAYPITPQTHIVEELSEMCSQGDFDAKFLKVESEHSAMASVIGASSTGVRSFTATSSQGLALMHELLHWAAGARLPIVMVNVNRALAPGWNIWADQGDSLAQRDTGWIQLYVEDNQEVLDSVIQGYMISETVNLPVMICYDAFFLSHTYEPVDIPSQEEVDNWLPVFKPEVFLDTDNPAAFNGLVMPDSFMEMRYKLQQAHDQARQVVKMTGKSFGDAFNRYYSSVEEVDCDQAEIILVASSSMTSPARMIQKKLRAAGQKIGLLKIRLFRPFPVDEVRKALGSARKIVVLDRNCSWGKCGIFADEIRSVINSGTNNPEIFGYIVGLGGKSVTPQLIEEILEEVSNNKASNRLDIWKGIKL